MRPRILMTVSVVLAIALIGFLARTPDIYSGSLLYPFKALLGTSHDLNSRLLEVTESSESIRSAGRRLLQPFGVVRLVHVYDSSEPENLKKN